jgi:SAM-dependent methyltransferase
MMEPNNQGTAQTWDPDRYARNASFVPELGQAALELLDPRPGERILDVGCGHGVLTEKLSTAGARVVGVDASAEQVAAARARGLDARVMSGEALTFSNEFDAVFSNAALHWMQRPDAVIAGVWNALVPGGRFVGEFGGGDNVRTTVRALSVALGRRGIDGAAVFPWYFPDDGEYRQKLEGVGFQVRSCVLIPRPTPLPGDIADWMHTFCEAYLKAVPPTDEAAFISEVRTDLKPHLCDGDGRWTVDYVRLRFHAVKPETA